MAFTLILVGAVAVPSQGGAVISFTDLGAGLPGGSAPASVAWGDYDNDGDLDILLTGGGISESIYRNDAGVFTAISTGLPGGPSQAFAWGDYDNDGDLDILLVRALGYGEYVSHVYRNDAGMFTELDVGLTGVINCAVAWGDYDNDGDLDILLAGDTGSERISRVYRSDGAVVFTDIKAGLPGVQVGSAAWGDFDNDGDLDILLTGDTGSGYISEVYRNDGAGVFIGISAGLPGVASSSGAWGDYDSDGDLDILLAGYDGSASISRVYRNDGAGVFTDFSTGLIGVTGSAAVWGDYDNDGDLDILLMLSDQSPPGNHSRVFRNDAGTFTDIAAGLQDAYWGQVAWGDYDNDRDLDILLTGYTGSEWISRVYRSDGAPANTPPAAPSDLSALVDEGYTTLTWNGSVDSQTPAAGLSYNLRIGTTPGGSEISSAMANPANGYRRVVDLGNAQQSTSWTVRLPGGQYYWSVQAVDGGFSGSPFAAEQSFQGVGIAFNVAAVLPGVDEAAVAWGDYDNDGDLDILLTGDAGTEAISRIYRNDAGVFTDIAAGLPAVRWGLAQWGDCDNDGDLDLLLTGGDPYMTSTYRNDAGVFTPSWGLPGMYWGSAAALGDYDNDGDLDVLLTGDMLYGRIARVYRNDAGVFTDIAAGLPGVAWGSVAWGDYDNDGDLDILLTGEAGAGYGCISRIYRNDGGEAFTDVAAGLPGVAYSSVAWGDYDNDGDLDILLAGTEPPYQISRIYRNDGAGVFTNINAGLPGVGMGSVAWGDYDNDGDLDILLAGANAEASILISSIYRNDDAGVFTEIEAGLATAGDGSVAWGDYDNDGDLDILLTGQTGSESISRVYRSDGAEVNTPPEAPTALSAQVEGSQVTLSWDAATDGQTPAAGMSYNLRIGTTPGAGQIMPPMANPQNGYRQVVRLGNAQQRTSWVVRLTEPGVHYWSVQAVDGAYAGGPFTSEQSFASTIDVTAAVPADLSFALAGANPVAGEVDFRFGLPTGARVSLSIYDVSGRRVARLVDGELPAGNHVASWNSREVGAAPGVYFAKFTADGQGITRRILILQ